MIPMTTTVKLIIELPTDKYLSVKTNMISDFIYDAVKHGIPLDSNSDSTENLNMEREQAYYRGYEDGIQKGRESAENKGEWIPIKDQLPKDGEEVLVSLTPNGVHGKKVDIDCFMMSDIKYWQSGKVEAWQPKPEPYKGKE